MPRYCGICPQNGFDIQSPFLETRFPLVLLYAIIATKEEACLEWNHAGQRRWNGT